MKNASLFLKPGVTPKALHILFECFKGSGLLENPAYEAYAGVAAEFRKEHPDLADVTNIRQDFGPQDFEFPEDFPSGQRFDIILGFENFCKAVYNVYQHYEPRFKDFSGFPRPVTPPVEVYAYVGHNKLDIKPSRSSYIGLLQKQ